MDKITKNISKIEKTLFEMKNEITNLKNLTYNTNATNSLNNSINYLTKNYHSIKIKDTVRTSRKKLKIARNYFQLSDKEKYFPSQNNKKNLNIYNNIIVNSDNSNKNSIFETNDKDFKNHKIGNKEIHENLKLDLVLGDNKKFNKASLLKDIKEINNNINNSFEGNIMNNNNDTYFNQKINNNNHFKKYFKNNLTSNKYRKRKTINSKILNEYNKKSSSAIHIQLNKKNKENDLINEETKENNKYNFNDISLLCNNNKNMKKSVIKNYLQKEDLKNNNFFNYSTQNHFMNLYKSSSYNNPAIDIYSQILNIIGEDSINNIIKKSNLFDKYGYNGFKKYINNKDFNLEDSSNYLLKYKNHISLLGKRDELNEQINIYKQICYKLIKMANSSDLNKLMEEINIKIRKNTDNKTILEKAKNILNG